MTNFFTLVSTDIKEQRLSFYTDTQLPDLKLSIGWGRINPVCKSTAEIKQGILDFYPEREWKGNAENGAKSLTAFIHFNPGDIVFVRGNAEIIDVAIVTGPAYYDKTGYYPKDYYLKVPFVPLFSNSRTTLRTAEIPDEIYNDVIYEGGRSIVIRELSEETARKLLKAILIKL